MYLDSIVALGLVIVILCCIMISYVGIYVYKHIKADMVSHQNEMGS